MAEIAPVGGGGANRTFLLIVFGLAAILVIGLISAGALFLLPALLGTRSVAAVRTVTPTRVAIAVATATVTVRVPTATPVLGALETTSTPTATALPPTATGTATPVPPTGTPPAPTQTATPEEGSNLPETGLGDDLLALGLGLILAVVILLARRARTAG